ncbi:MAG: AbrB/MazE/SpoVT family DNA-binding domain-containing protein [Armatimonadota bacterium]
MSTSDELNSMGKYFFGAVTVGERGQIVIPADARKQCGMDPGDKLLVFHYPTCRGLLLAGVDQMNRIHAMLRVLLDEAEAMPPEAEATEDD